MFARVKESALRRFVCVSPFVAAQPPPSRTQPEIPASSSSRCFIAHPHHHLPHRRRTAEFSESRICDLLFSSHFLNEQLCVLYNGIFCPLHVAFDLNISTAHQVPYRIELLLCFPSCSSTYPHPSFLPKLLCVSSFCFYATRKCNLGHPSLTNCRTPIPKRTFFLSFLVVQIIYRVVDLVFIADVFLNFNTGFYDKNSLLVMDHARIAQRYIHTWFVVRSVLSFLAPCFFVALRAHRN